MKGREKGYLPDLYIAYKKINLNIAPFSSAVFKENIEVLS